MTIRVQDIVGTTVLVITLMERASLVVKMDSREICVMLVSLFIIVIYFIAIIVQCLYNYIAKVDNFGYSLQRGI